MPTVFYTTWLSCDGAKFRAQPSSHFTFIDCIFVCFITFYVINNTHQCIIYSMHCQSLLSESSGQISAGDLNTKCMRIEFK